METSLLDDMLVLLAMLGVGLSVIALFEIAEWIGYNLTRKR